MDNITLLLAQELNKPAELVENVIKLLDEGNTIPFIARYRKEAHGAMDDTTLRELEDRLKYLRNLQDRKEEVLRLIEKAGKLTPAITEAVQKAATLAEVEDIYRPYKQKRKTRASIAKEKGLEPLAVALFSQKEDMPDPEELAKKYIDPEKGVNTAEEALKGASDILAEVVSDSPNIRKAVKEYYNRRGLISAGAAKEEDSVYSQYYDFAQPLSKLQGYQVLAINRGEKEGFLKTRMETDRDGILHGLERRLIKKNSKAENFLRNMIKDSYDRLLSPSVENELRAALTEDACEGAIRNFKLNLKPLLMQPPVKGKVILALDPGYRMGCKTAVIDSTGKVLDTAVVYPTLGERQEAEAIEKLYRLIRKHHVERIAIGNGTASRETEKMTVKLLEKCPGVSYMIVSEAGASVYSASKLAAEEFPDYDVNLRSAVSIARRMQDPLAELVKIDPKAIGVGQYQHDVPQKRLGESLESVVEDCVNAVGVDLNTASPFLLQRVSGLNGAMAKNIVAYREENGAFSSRREVLKVPKIGAKSYEQAAGFLRVPESRNILDNTGVHPESYKAAETLLSACGYTLQDVKDEKLSGLPAKVKTIGEEKAAALCGIGVPTLQDIVQELIKPGRDIREELPDPVFSKDVMDISDLKPGMRLKGTVRNVIDFGAFVDIGVHQDGLVHVSEIADRFIKHPSQVLSVGQTVDVVVLGVDEKKKRISLSIKQAKG
ncbi:MAG: RNA-binding transcriptional accessory protein [Eubacterium sp.]|nr:RNA-binding transcriptional accessory protein [Eubacterium sp.]